MDSIGSIAGVAKAAAPLFQTYGAIQSAGAAQDYGSQQWLLANYQSQQQRQRAGQEQAVAQRAGADEERYARLLASRAVAVAGASGGGVTDPTVNKVIADISGEGAYRSALKIWQGDEAARSLNAGADASLYGGGLARNNADAVSRAYMIKGAGSGLSNIGSFYSKYGGGGPKGGLDMAGISASGHAQNLSFASGIEAGE